MSNDNVRVIVRIRPLLPAETKKKLRDEISQGIKDGNKQLNLEDPANNFSHTFSFTHVFGSDNTQADVYETTAKSAVTAILDGRNATVMAYGQTGAGKTHSIFGPDMLVGVADKDDGPDAGLVGRAALQVMTLAEDAIEQKSAQVSCSYLEIYNEAVADLLVPTSKSPSPSLSGGLKIRESADAGMLVEGLTEQAVTTVQVILLFKNKSEKWQKPG